MASSLSSYDVALTPGSDPGRLDAVRRFWNDNVHNWKIARHEVATKAFFEEIEAYRFEKLAYLPRLVDFKGFSGKSVLDVGCGVGNDLSRFARGGARVVGVDLSEHAIALAQANFSQRGLSGEFHVMNGEQLDLPDNSVDLVYCHTVLHFTPDPDRMVEEIRRVLKPGGLAIVMMVNRRSWLRLLHRIMHIEIDHLDAPVFHWYGAAKFRHLLAGFRDVRIVTERFPVRTKVHRGLKAILFNALFVDVFNAMPRSWVRWSGHHMMAFARKAAPADADRWVR